MGFKVADLHSLQESLVKLVDLWRNRLAQEVARIRNRTDQNFYVLFFYNRVLPRNLTWNQKITQIKKAKTSSIHLHVGEFHVSGSGGVSVTNYIPHLDPPHP